MIATADFALVAAAFALGALGTPHCAAMCGPVCAAITRGSGSKTEPQAATVMFHALRLASYAAGGAVLAGGLSWLQSASLSGAQLASQSAFTGQESLRLLWTMLQVVVLGFGLWMLVLGRQPALLANLGRSPLAACGVRRGAGVGAGAVSMSGPALGDRGQTITFHPPGSLRAASMLGSLWVLWPCGLLQSALLTAAMAQGPVGGATAMAAFALASSPGLLVGPWLLKQAAARLGSKRLLSDDALQMRLAGGLVALASGWALGHGLWMRTQGIC